MKKILVLLGILVFSLSVYSKTTSTSKTTKTETVVKTVEKDGKTLETAIKVNTVEEEYRYLQNNYPGSKVTMQKLIYGVDGTPYDVLTVIHKNNETADYYFDVTQVFLEYQKNFK